MRVYADGSSEWVLRPGFLDVHPRGGVTRRIAWEEPPKKAPLGPPMRSVLAVPSPGLAWLGMGRGVRVVPLDREDVRDVAPLGIRVLDAVGLPGGKVLACAHLEGERAASLRVVDGKKPDFAASRPLEVPASARIEWPVGAIWKKGKESWPKEPKKTKATEGEAGLFEAIAVGHPQKDGARFFDPVVLTKSAHGLAGVSYQSGLVFAVSADGARIEAAFRVPCQEEAEFHAVRSALGVLVTIVAAGRESAVLHVALDGTVLGAISKVGKSMLMRASPPILIGDTVFVSHDADVLLELRAKDLDLLAKHTDHSLGSADASVAHFDGGALIATGGKCFRIELASGAPKIAVLEGPAAPAAAKKRSDDDELGLDEGEGGGSEDEDEDEDEEGPAHPIARPRAAGAPSLTLAEAAAPSVWQVAPGSTLNVTVGFANLGGVSRGVYVEVAGPAVQSGLLGADDVRLGGTSTPFEKKGMVFRAEVPTVELAAGLVPDVEDKRTKLPLYDQVHRANVGFRGLKAGAGLVTVRIGPMKAEPGRGAVVQGKTAQVR